MAAPSESQRHDLYTVLSNLLGPEPASTLMAYLPTEPAHRLATRSDLDLLETRLVARLEGLESRMDRLNGRMDRFETRMDHLFLALIAGMVAIVATLITAFFVV